MNAALSDWDASPDADDRQPWERTFVLFPRVALKVSRSGVERRLLLPGRYETRHSRSFGKPLFREVRD
jgi:hypothetical protein